MEVQAHTLYIVTKSMLHEMYMVKFTFFIKGHFTGWNRIMLREIIVGFILFPALTINELNMLAITSKKV